MISLDHVNLVTTRLDETIRFYCAAFGLTSGWVPPNTWDEGAWLYASSGKPVLHVQAVREETYDKFKELASKRYVTKSIPALADFEGTGTIDHISLASDDYEGVQRRLTTLGVPFQLNEIPQAGVFQVFSVDPNGVLVEINCMASAPVEEPNALSSVER